MEHKVFVYFFYNQPVRVLSPKFTIQDLTLSFGLIEEMTPEEQGEVECFAAFVIARRKLQKPQVLTDDISTQELIRLVESSGSFDWLDAEEEDVYSADDGETVRWQSKSHCLLEEGS